MVGSFSWRWDSFSSPQKREELRDQEKGGACTKTPDVTFAEVRKCRIMAADVDSCGLCSGTSNYHQLMKLRQGVYRQMFMLYMKRSTDSIKHNNFKESVKPHVPTLWNCHLVFQKPPSPPTLKQGRLRTDKDGEKERKLKTEPPKVVVR